MTFRRADAVTFFSDVHANVTEKWSGLPQVATHVRPHLTTWVKSFHLRNPQFAIRNSQSAIASPPRRECTRERGEDVVGGELADAVAAVGVAGNTRRGRGGADARARHGCLQDRVARAEGAPDRR